MICKAVSNYKRKYFAVGWVRGWIKGRAIMRALEWKELGLKGGRTAGRVYGRKEAVFICKLVKNLLRRKVRTSVIKEITGASDELLKYIKQSLWPEFSTSARKKAKKAVGAPTICDSRDLRLTT